MEEEPEQEVRVTHPTPKTTSFPPPPEFTRNATPHESRNERTTPSFTFIAGKEQLGAIAILLAIIGAFFSTVAFSLDHAAPSLRLHQHIFSEYNLIIAVLIIIGLVFAYFHPQPQHQWIYVCICCTSIVFVLLTLANFIFHICLIDQTDEKAISKTDYQSLSVVKIVKAGAAFTFMDGLFKVLIAAICVVIIVLKV
uniref:MARVEL domain-containing protein n=1 Tax=Panagrolaimus superbus TaxID=310955 RepID=A0A914YGG1_9BILA